MCLKILKPKNPDKISESKIAKKDIVCYKILKTYRYENVDILVSPYREALYYLETIMESKLFCCMANEGQLVTEGLHTYIRYQDAKEDVDRLHTLKWIIVKCIIPKEAKYYTGKFNATSCRASDKLLPLTIIE